MKVAVLGAGVIGVTTAHALARDGHEVVVVEREAEAASFTSFANGGLIHVSLVDPWNAPGIARKALRWLGKDAPAVIRPGALPGLLRWGFSFIRNSAPEKHRKHTFANLRLALLSSAAVKRVRAEEAIAYDHGERGLLQIFRDEAGLEHARGFARMLEPHGVRHRILDRAAVIEAEPALAEVRDSLVGAVHYPDDESGDCALFTRRLAGAAAARHGVEFRYGTEVEGLEVERGRVAGVRTDGGRIEADAYVLALGIASPIFAKAAGLDLPIYPVKGYSLTLDVRGWNAAPRMPVTDEKLKMGVVPLGDRLRIAGSAEFTGARPEPDPARVRYMVEGAAKIYPALQPYATPDRLGAWSGLRPMTPEGPPLLGPTQVPNLFLNTGHGHLGWTMACGSAEVLAAAIGGRTPPIDLDGLTYARYGRT